MTPTKAEFQEIANCGGTITFAVRANAQGQRGYQTSFSSSRPVPSTLIGVYALPQGIPVGTIKLGGIGTPSNPPPDPSCVAVLIGSDSTGHFGHLCPRCRGYWRGEAFPNVCPYCRLRAPAQEFLSDAQRRYVHHFCDVLMTALDADEDGEHVIDMDAVADATTKEGERPAFYVSEQSQQHQFSCAVCESFNDILGRFGYCAVCGTRNDLAEFQAATVADLRVQLNNDIAPEKCLRDAVSAFDSMAAQLCKELAKLVPMTERRRARLSIQRFHNAEELRRTLREWFDIDVGAGLSDADWAAIVRKFHRRHIYEHNGGEVDQKYLDDSGDTTVRLKQRIYETREEIHDLLGKLDRVARNLHGGFHELIQPNPEPIKLFEDKKRRIAEVWRR